MKSDALLSTTLLFFCLGLAGAPGSVQAQPVPGAPVTVGDYRLGAGDVLGAAVFQNPDLSLDVRVSEGGQITYPLIGLVEVGGLTLMEAQQRIAQALRGGGYVRDPQVTLVLRQMRGHQVSVLGQVARPGRFVLENTQTRVSEVLAAAGGVAAGGDDWLVVTGTRSGQPLRKRIDVQALFGATPSADDLVLAAGDTLYVGKAPQFYIYGAAQRPGAYRIERGMTVQQALAAGGGLTPRGSQKRLKLHRKDGQGQVTEITPTLADAVQPEDVLFVGESLF